MNLSELKTKVEQAIEHAVECGASPDEITVSLQIEDSAGETAWANENVELHYDNNCQASGCVLLADLEDYI
ncbi:hypothetical protein [uncultured Desulfobacter sp.]|uniref:hypothetical protein n=1 Tax=uncultured Desulfobacter sp. TaxID=240139 RepID=UPI0029F570F4|nr:hypothetical protein [uncultured Desulfobacter sp.]